MAASRQAKAERDARTAWTYASHAVIRADQVADDFARPELVDEVYQSFAGDLYTELEGDRDRLYAAARQACIAAAEEVAAPDRWRVGLCAVELCQRAARMAE
uniref:hypothetical protein n=1 Tax=Sphaerisporangium sp. CA-236357 TaxID=3240030 RepID=UPI003F498D7B